jgi:hypothetical protein
VKSSLFLKKVLIWIQQPVYFLNGGLKREFKIAFFVIENAFENGFIHNESGEDESYERGATQRVCKWDTQPIVVRNRIQQIFGRERNRLQPIALWSAEGQTQKGVRVV